MAVPRLQDEECFLRLDPEEIDDIDHATTIGGSSELGEQVGPEEMEPIELVVSGSVAMTEDGKRVGKGEGYSDLEFAVLREFGLVDDDTTTVTTVHEIQVVDEGVPTTPQDVPIDWLFTPERSVRTEAADDKPTGVNWAVLGDDRLDEIPVLRELKSG
jgi:5-formyltetrahydrofolate cyclo-ligase